MSGNAQSFTELHPFGLDGQASSHVPFVQVGSAQVPSGHGAHSSTAGQSLSAWQTGGAPLHTMEQAPFKHTPCAQVPSAQNWQT